MDDRVCVPGLDAETDAAGCRRRGTTNACTWTVASVGGRAASTIAVTTTRGAKVDCRCRSGVKGGGHGRRPWRFRAGDGGGRKNSHPSTPTTHPPSSAESARVRRAALAFSLMMRNAAAAAATAVVYRPPPVYWSVDRRAVSGSNSSVLAPKRPPRLTAHACAPLRRRGFTLLSSPHRFPFFFHPLLVYFGFVREACDSNHHHYYPYVSAYHSDTRFPEIVLATRSVLNITL